MISDQQAHASLNKQLAEIKEKLMVSILEAIESAFATQQPQATPQGSPEELTWDWEAQPASSFDEFLETRVSLKNDPSATKTVKQHLESLQLYKIEEFLRSTGVLYLPTADTVAQEFYAAVASGHKSLLLYKSAMPLLVKDSLRALALCELKDKAGSVELRCYFPEPLMMRKVDLEYCLTVMNTVLGFTFYYMPHVRNRSKAISRLQVSLLPVVKAIPTPDPTFLANTRLLISKLVDLGPKSLDRCRLEAALAKEEAIRSRMKRQGDVIECNLNSTHDLIEIV